MNDVAIGRSLRALRRRRVWRQVDLAERAGVSQGLVSAVERGHIGSTTLETLRRLVAVLDARLELVASWRGADLDRLLDEDHARLVGIASRRLEVMEWQVRLEVTYNDFGDRGSIDIVGLRPDVRAAVVVEVKSALPSAEATGRKLDEKARIVPSIIEKRYGWRPSAIGRLLVVPGTMQLRRLLDGSEALRRMFPAGPREVRPWLRQPVGALAGVWFLSDISPRNRRDGRTVRTRVRMPRPRSSEPQLGPDPGPIERSTVSKNAGGDMRVELPFRGPISASGLMSEPSAAERAR
jgi:transcriptional regulator with XRE-family HTH domain